MTGSFWTIEKRTSTSPETPLFMLRTPPGGAVRDTLLSGSKRPRGLFFGARPAVLQRLRGLSRIFSMSARTLSCLATNHTQASLHPFCCLCSRPFSVGTGSPAAKRSFFCCLRGGGKEVEGARLDNQRSNYALVRGASSPILWCSSLRIT